MFVESSQGIPGDNATLTSMFGEVCGLELSYHMFGDSNMGALAVSSSESESGPWTLQWKESGDQGR